ncbi:Nuclease SbcCD subunit D [Methylobacterium cerastii]|uniref:Nuclease SbcCD subunit D n=2 Tax=Methylobacterium TaxID=407 RepID=A0ABQ4U532_9HYPH|nr:MULTISPECIES: exonuclease SbcCD subunit D [Methylobacterium]TXM79405.1 exonuclease SbcCD subunit D [Methylobacterium sp. WL69]TXN23637.1 exonuclease SbcCD subunit D [Methylobacterium sp. WL19]GJD42341.1 Nuclease SbcCD subunit D [Methylobacterium cerastii]GJE62214.1 Nuclease SbcCD subunit D [Methylobacterium trifolii]
MIRVLHTGDWHIGQTLRGFLREHEHARVFDALVALVEEREPDALVMAGDVFDSQNPSGEAQRLFYETLVRLHQARPAMTIVVTAGNHDAAGRLEAPRALLDAIGVHVVGNVRRPGGAIDLSRHLVPIRKDGAVAGHVLGVSYPTAACLPGLTAGRVRDEAGSPIVRAVRDLYAALHEAARPELAGLPYIVTGHLHVAGGLESEGAERRILVGGEHAVPPDVFPEDADYVALGHLHRAQEVGRPIVRYSGSLIPLSATELAYRHGVSLVTIGDGPARTEHVVIDRPVLFLRLPEAGDMALGELGDRLAALDLDPGLPVEARPFLQIRLARAGLPAGYRAEVDRIAERFPVRVVDVRVASVDAPSPDLAPVGGPMVRLAERDPEDLFRMAFLQTHGVEPAAPHLDVFHRARAGA